MSTFVSIIFFGYTKIWTCIYEIRIDVILLIIEYLLW